MTDALSEALADMKSRVETLREKVVLDRHERVLGIASDEIEAAGRAKVAGDAAEVSRRVDRAKALMNTMVAEVEARDDE